MNVIVVRVTRRTKKRKSCSFLSPFSTPEKRLQRSQTACEIKAMKCKSRMCFVAVAAAFRHSRHA